MIDVGTVLDQRYEILAKLGEGGFGIVYKVNDLQLNNVCAVKLLTPAAAQDAKWLARFKREASAMASIDHPNVARVFRLGVEGQPFLVMEYLSGCSLRTRLGQSPPLSEQEVLRILSQTCQAMSAAHQSNVLHRDLKPDNIMLTTDPTCAEALVKVVDFGLARSSKPTQDATQHLTQTGTLVGSVHYMSPEQCQGRRCTERSDIYSLGCVMYECFTGQPPFDADSMVAILQKHQTAPVPTAKTKDGQLLRSDLNVVIAKALRKSPSERYHSMADFEQDIQSCIAGVPPKYGQISKAQTVQGQPKQTVTVACLGASICLLIILSQCLQNGVLQFGDTSDGTRWNDIKEKSSNKKSVKGKLESALAEADTALLRNDPSMALNLIDTALVNDDEPHTADSATSNFQRNQLTRQALLQSKKSVALMSLGHKLEAKASAEKALILLSKLLDNSGFDNRVWHSANDALKVLLACNYFENFDYRNSDPEALFDISDIPKVSTLSDAIRQTCKNNPRSTFILLDAYIKYLQEAKRSDDALAFMRGKIADLSKSGDQAQLFQYNRALAQVQKELEALMPGIEKGTLSKRNETYLLLSLSSLLSSDIVAAKHWLTKVTDFKIDTTGECCLTPTMINRFIDCAEGKPNQALEAIPASQTLPTINSCPAYQKLFMAQIAIANGHQQDVPRYLSAAKLALSQFLGPDNPIVKGFDTTEL